jgi:hypothetical protein
LFWGGVFAWGVGVFCVCVGGGQVGEEGKERVRGFLFLG